MPYGANNALVKAAKVVNRLADYRPSPYVDELWSGFVNSLDLDPALKAALLDPIHVDESIAKLAPGMAKYAWSATHTTFSPNVCHGGVKTNVIPDVVDVEVDIRTIPGDNEDEVRRHIDKALGDLSEEVEVDKLFSKPASMSPTGTPLWDVLGRVVDAHYPGAKRLGHGKGYRYPHDFPDAKVDQEYRPPPFAGKRYYEPSGHGEETEEPQDPGRRDGSRYDAPTRTEETE